MSTLLYIDAFNERQSAGLTTNRHAVAYNLRTLNRLNPQSAPVFSVGRYICLLRAVDMEGSQVQMIFFDVHTADEEIKMLVGDPDIHPDLRAQFVSLIETTSAGYMENYGVVELVLGAPPLSPV